MKKRKTVTACVTSQKNCERIILAAKKIAEEEKCPLYVLSIQNSGEMTLEQCEAVEYLYELSKQNGAQMTVCYSDFAALTAIEFLKRNNSGCVVTGVPSASGSGFVSTVSSVLPKIRISMVSDDGRIYSYFTTGCKAAAFVAV